MMGKARSMTRDISKMEHRIIKSPPLNVVLYQPEIPANTGNVARLCGATEIRLHLVHPLGFSMDDKHLKRAGLDYWEGVKVTTIDNLTTFLKETSSPFYFLSSKGKQSYADINYPDDVILIFGSEVSGAASVHMV